MLIPNTTLCLEHSHRIHSSNQSLHTDSQLQLFPLCHQSFRIVFHTFWPDPLVGKRTVWIEFHHWMLWRLCSHIWRHHPHHKPIHSCNTYRSFHDLPIQISLPFTPSQKLFRLYLNPMNTFSSTVWYLLLCLLELGTNRTYRLDTRNRLYKCQLNRGRVNRLSYRVILCLPRNMFLCHSLHANDIRLPIEVRCKFLRDSVSICTEQILDKYDQDSDPNFSQC